MSDISYFRTLLRKLVVNIIINILIYLLRIQLCNCCLRNDTLFNVYNVFLPLMIISIYLNKPQQCQWSVNIRKILAKETSVYNLYSSVRQIHCPEPGGYRIFSSGY